jgi:Carboxypeptidase regulatory-like domain
MKLFRISLLLLSVMLLCSLRSLSQTAVTSLYGTVEDPGGAVAPQVDVTIVDMASGFTQTRKSNADGEYSFQQIPPGKYKITVRAAGFAQQIRQVELLVNQPVKLDVKLTLQSESTTVEVSAQTVTLNTSDATIGTPFNQAQIQALPFEGNNVLDLLSLQGGVMFLGRQTDSQMDSDSRSGSVNGARSDQNNYTLDGLDDNNQNKGYAFEGVLRSTRDSVEEFRVVTTNSNADSGRSSGAQVALVTRSGTNAFHGTAYEYNRPTNMVANDWFNKHSELANGEPNVPGKLLRNTFGGSFGGPILKDRLFFFLAYEGQRTAESTQVTREVPTAALRQGNVTYLASDGTTKTLTPTDIASMDPGCSAAGTCPNGAGVNAAALAYLSQLPLPNGNQLGDGFNFGSYTFSSPSPQSLTTYIAKIDYNLNAKQRLFVRGNLQKDTTVNPKQYPTSQPNSARYDNSKGISAGHVWTISDTVVNNVRYGFVRQGYADRGTTNQDYVTFSNVDTFSSSNLGTTYPSSIINVPTHNAVDDVTWVKGKHTLQAGVNYRAIFNNRTTDSTAHKYANVTSNFLTVGSIAGTGSSLDPGSFGLPSVDTSFKTAYNSAISDVTGLITHSVEFLNYGVSGNSLSPLPSGTLTTRHYLSNELEYYLQDSWKVRPNLTLTFGLRHSLLQVPYERDGQEVSPTTSVQDWFNTRGAQMLQGQTYDPRISFGPAGSANGKAGLWSMDKLDIAPRFAFAYSPSFDRGLLSKLVGSQAGRTSIRGGFGMYYDHFGEGIMNTFDSHGSFGLSTQAENGVDQHVDTAPRFSGPQSVPTAIIPVATSAGTFPVTPGDSVAISYGLDSKLHTPYAYGFDLAISRELSKGLIVEAAYTGRLAHRLLQQRDLAMPLDLVDPKGGGDYFAAATQMTKLANAGTPVAKVAANPYWEHMFPGAATGGLSATQNIYQTEFSHFNSATGIWSPIVAGNETAALYDLDLGISPADSTDPTFRYFDPQYASFYAWSSIGTSSYHALQLSLHHPMQKGLQFDFNYVFGKSSDLGSDAERGYNGQLFSSLINSWNIRGNRGPSDFDVRHSVVGNAVVALPFGRGAAFLSGVNRAVDALIGGWTLSGLAHWTSGLPFSTIDGLGWGTNWNNQSFNILTGPVVTGGHNSDANGNPNVFNNQAQALANIRAPYPGETGQRNILRGDGYFSIDSGLSKVFRITERQNLKFSFEVFNVTNSVRFDPNSIANNPFGSASTFGDYSALLTRPRVVQLSLRYAF